MKYLPEACAARDEDSKYGIPGLALLLTWTGVKIPEGCLEAWAKLELHDTLATHEVWTGID